MLFLRNHDWKIKAPDLIWFYEKASLKCPGYQIISDGSDATSWFPYVPSHHWDFYKFKIIDHSLCLLARETQRNYSGPRYDKDCWVNLTTFNKKSYQVFTDCKHRCFSKYRVRDGVFDCPYEGAPDERMNLSCPTSYQQPYRFHCSSSENSCLMPLAIGNVDATCINERDEITLDGLALKDAVHCWQRNDEDCLFLQDYIRQSPGVTTFKSTYIHNQNVIASRTIKLPFQYYCDSFLNTNNALDESNEFCQQWTCRTDQYQCLTGQCISLEWICDGKVTAKIISTL